MKRLKLFIKWSAIGFAAFLLLICLSFALIQTDMGSRYLTDKLLATINGDPDFRVDIEGISGLIPFDFKIRHIDLSDSRGKWLSLDDASLRWAPSELFKKRFHIFEISAGAGRLERLPASKEKQTKEPEKPFSWPPPFLDRAPDRIPDLAIEKLRIGRFSLGRSILGAETVFTASGRGKTIFPSTGAEGSFKIERIEGPRALLDVKWSVSGKIPVFTIHVRAEDSEAGLLKTAAGLKDPIGTITMEFTGKGPLNDWTGRMTAEASRFGRIETWIRATFQKDLKMAATGEIRLAPDVLPGTVAPYFKSNRTRFVLDVLYQDLKELIVNRLDLDTQGYEFKLKGRLFDAEKKTLDATFTVGVDDLSVLNDAIGNQAKGKLVVRGTISGPFSKPRAKISLSLKEPEMAGFRASTTAWDFDVRPAGELFPSFQGLFFKVGGNVEGLSLPPDAPVIPVKQFQWTVSGELDNEARIKIDECIIENKDARITYSGTANLSVPSFKGLASIDIKDLNRFKELLPSDIHAAFQTEAKVEGNGNTNLFSADIKGKITEIRPLPDALTALIGDRIAYSGLATFSGAKILSVSGLKLESTAAKTEAQASIHLDDRKVKANIRLLLPDLARLSKSVGRPIEGKLSVDLGVEGSLRDPVITADAFGVDVRLDDRWFPEIQLKLDARDVLQKPSGKITIRLTEKNHTLRAAGDYRLDKKRLTLSGLSLVAPGLFESGSGVTGDLDIDMESLTGNGKLNGVFDDLKPIFALWGESIGGSATVEAIFSTKNKAQDVVLSIEGKKLATRFGRVDEAVFQARVKDIFQSPEAAVEAKIKSFQKDKLHLDSVSLKANGDTKKTAFSITADGRYEEKFQVQTRGSVELKPTGESYRIDLLEGRFADLPIALVRPLEAERSRDRFLLEAAEVNLGDGSLRASGNIGADSILIDAVLERLPLTFLKLFGYPEILGSAGARVQVTGRPGRPEGKIELRIKDIRSTDPSFQNLPPAQLSADFACKDDRFRANVLIEGISEKPVTAELEIPVSLSLSPPSVSVGRMNDIRGQVSARVNLERLATFFQLEDHILKGILTADIGVAGSLEKPDVKGGVRFSDVMYENLSTGTIIKDVQIDTRVSDKRIVLENVQATDGAAGSISAKGWLDILPVEHFPLELDLSLTNAMLLRRDELTATADGRLNLSGSTKTAKLSGNIKIGPAELRIPGSFPPEIKDIEVVEINLPERKPEPAKEKRQSSEQDIALELALEIPGQVFVRGRGLESEWKGNLRILGTASKPLITGELSVIRGRYNFFGKAFSLKKGVIAFEGNTPPSPGFDVTAEHTRSGIITRFIISGTPASLEVSIESDPPMPSDEILSHLLFGRSAASITPFQAVRLAQAAGSLTGKGGMLDFMDRTRKLLGVDQMGIKDSGGDMSVSVGKYVRENVYVEVEKGLRSEHGKVSVEVELTPSISIETDAGANADAGVGISWKWDY